jgi:hypothetical protein
MTSRIYGNVLVLGVVTALAACAGTPSNDSSAAPVAAAPASAATAAAAPKKPAGTGTGYRLVSKSGQEMYCRKEQTTGSLTRARELCITPAEMEARTHHDQALIHELQNAPNVTQSNAPSP